MYVAVSKENPRHNAVQICYPDISPLKIQVSFSGHPNLVTIPSITNTNDGQWMRLFIKRTLKIYFIVLEIYNYNWCGSSGVRVELVQGDLSCYTSRQEQIKIWIGISRGGELPKGFH